MRGNADEYLRYFTERVLRDALHEATVRYWSRRADQFAAVGTPACDEIAAACRRRAAFQAMYPPLDLDPIVTRSPRGAS